MNGKSNWGVFKYLLAAVACLVLLVALFYAEEDWRGWHAWNRYQHQWEAKGERFNFASAVPAAVPDDQNFAVTPVVASCYLYILDTHGHRISPQDTNVVNRLNMAVPADTAKEIGNWQKSTASSLQSPGSALLALSKYNSTIAELREAAKLPDSRFPVNYDNEPPAGILLPHLASLKKCGLVLQARAIAELQTGQSDLALADVKLGIQLTDKIRTEPFLISHLVRIAMLQIALQPIWEGLARHQWSDTQLVELDQELGRLNFLADYESTMRGERTLDIANIEYLRRTHQFNLMDDPGKGPPSFQRMGLRLMPNSWFYQNELTIARMYEDRIFPSVDVEHQTVSLAAVHRNEAAITNRLTHFTFYDVFAKMLFPGVSPAVRRFTYAQQSADLARVAIALERYRLAHGEYPETLDALTPPFLDKPPHDVINGEPLHYRRTADGQFVLYSVGWNETDDEGEVVLQKGSTPGVDLNQGDWVWQYPAR